MKLSAMPKAFHLTELKKGYYPHMFWPEEGFDYKGEWPEAKDYSPGTMFKEGQGEFYQWLQQQSGKSFNLKEEMVAYCKSDVDILKQPALRFHDNIFKGMKNYQTQRKQKKKHLKKSKNIEKLLKVFKNIEKTLKLSKTLKTIKSIQKH